MTYDEHGGFYDHVPPPTGIPAPDAEPSQPDKGFLFDRLGVRIPTILVSPWIKRGTVISGPPAVQKPKPNSEYELSSILATARKLLGVGGSPLTARDAWAATFEHAIGDTIRGDCPLSLPDPPPPATDKIAAEAAMPLHQLQTHTIEVLARLNAVDPPRIASQGEVNPWVGAAFRNYHRRATRQQGIHGYALRCGLCNVGQWAELTWNVTQGPEARISTQKLEIGGARLCLEAAAIVEGSEVGVGVCAESALRASGSLRAS